MRRRRLPFGLLIPAALAVLVVALAVLQYRWLGQVPGSKYLARWQASLQGDRMIGQGEDEEGNPVVVVYRVDRGQGK